MQSYIGNYDNQGAELWDIEVQMKLIRSQISHLSNLEFGINIALYHNKFNSKMVHTVVSKSSKTWDAQYSQIAFGPKEWLKTLSTVTNCL